MINERIRPYLNFSFNDKKVIFVTLFVVSNLISNLLAIKVFNLGFWGLTTDCGNLLFPLGYLMADVITEVYGERTARRVILLGLFANILLIVATTLTVYMPYPSYWTGQEAYAYMFGFTPRIVFAGFIAYLVGQFVNARLMVLIKKWTNSKYLFMRTIGSTLVGELCDSCICSSIAYYGIVPNSGILLFILMQYVVKVTWEVVMQPLTYKSIAWARKDG